MVVADRVCCSKSYQFFLLPSSNSTIPFRLICANGMLSCQEHARQRGTSALEAMHEGSSHRHLKLVTSPKSDRMLSPPQMSSPTSAEDSKGAQGADYGSTPKLLSPQSAYLPEESWAIYDGPVSFAPAPEHPRFESTEADWPDVDIARNGVTKYPITMLLRQADRDATAATPSNKALLRGPGAVTDATFSTRSQPGQISRDASAASPAGDTRYESKRSQTPGSNRDEFKNAAVAKLNEVLFGPRSPSSSPLRQPLSRGGQDGVV